MLAILDPAIRRASPGRLQAAAVITTLGMLSLTVAAVSPATPTPASDIQATTSQVADRASLATEPPTPPAVPRRSATPSPSFTPSPSPSPTPSPSLHVKVDGPTTTSGVSVSVDGLMSVAGAAISNALHSVGAGLGRPAALQASDTGRIAVMIKVLGTDTDASVRRTAAWALHDIETADVRGALATALHGDADARVREMAAWALGEQGNASAASALSAALLHDKSAHVRGTSAWALGEIGAQSEVSALETAMTDSEPQVRETAIWALGELGVRNAPKSLTNFLTDESKQVRLITAWALSEIEDKSTAPAILAAFKAETDPQIRSAELRALAAMGQVTPEVVETALKSSDPEVRRRAVAMLAGSQSVEPWPWPRPQPRPSP